MILWTVAHQAPLCMGFLRQEYWSGLLLPSLGDLPNPGIEPESPVCPALAGGFITTDPSGKPYKVGLCPSKVGGTFREHPSPFLPWGNGSLDSPGQWLHGCVPNLEFDFGFQVMFLIHSPKFYIVLLTGWLRWSHSQDRDAEKNYICSFGKKHQASLG